MAGKRGASGLSLVVGVDKPLGLSSHDVVNRCRRIFGERRVGHTGTLDPAATGALLVCVGPAARLDAYFESDWKTYVARIALGATTDTDDAQGRVVERLGAPDKVLDAEFAQQVLQLFLGQSLQMPPVYSALKVGGKKACDEARKGNSIELQPRQIEVERAYLRRIVDGYGEVMFSSCGSDERLVSWMQETGDEPTYAGLPTWEVEFHVSKGTYIRSLARDIGLRIGCGAHLCALRRTKAGNLDLSDCVSLEALEQLGTQCCLDPLRLLNVRFFYLNDDQAARVRNGNQLRADEVTLCQRCFSSSDVALCACTSGVRPSHDPAMDQEVFGVVHDNKLVALYSFDGKRSLFASRCVFPEGVSRGIGV